jgi:hypothetical protein
MGALFFPLPQLYLRHQGSLHLWVNEKDITGKASAVIARPNGRTCTALYR